MMSLMVFTISAVNAWDTRETSFQFGWFWTALPKRLHPTLRVLYLDLLVYIKLFMMDVLHLNHQDVGIWQRLKLRSQISFWNLTQITEVKCVKALKHSVVWPNFCHSRSQQGSSRQTPENTSMLSAGASGFVYPFLSLTFPFQVFECSSLPPTGVLHAGGRSKGAAWLPDLILIKPAPLNPPSSDHLLTLVVSDRFHEKVLPVWIQRFLRRAFSSYRRPKEAAW